MTRRNLSVLITAATLTVNAMAIQPPKGNPRPDGPMNKMALIAECKARGIKVSASWTKAKITDALLAGMKWEKVTDPNQIARLDKIAAV